MKARRILSTNISNRTWACEPCRKTYRRVSSVASLKCPNCQEPCEFLGKKIRIPSSKRAKAWDDFWTKFRAEKALLVAFERGQLREDVTLELHGLYLSVEMQRRRAQRKSNP